MPIFWKEREFPSRFIKDEAAQILTGGGDAQSPAVNQVVVAGMCLPHVTAAPELGCDIEHRIRDLRDDIIPQQSWAVVDVEFIGPAGAEVPRFTGLGSEWAPSRKERTNLVMTSVALLSLNSVGPCPPLAVLSPTKIHMSALLSWAFVFSPI